MTVRLAVIVLLAALIASSYVQYLYLTHPETIQLMTDRAIERLHSSR